MKMKLLDDEIRRWLRAREIGCQRTIGFGHENRINKQLFSSITKVRSWNPADTVSNTHHGGIFNFDFSQDGSVLVAACEKRSILVFDPLNGNLVNSRENAHSDCVNCAKFLDSRVFATCSDDTTVCLWDVRYLKHKIRTLGGHSNWVKNVEYDSSSGLLVTSGFDGSVFTWDINRYSESDENYKQVFHTNGLMRTKLTPDGSKLIIATSTGYLMVVHDLDLHTLGRDLKDFKPSMYRLMQQTGSLIAMAYNQNHVFTRDRNRVELISDFPSENDAEMIASLEVHPQGWCVVSRNTNNYEAQEWTCVHDIQSPAAKDVVSINQSCDNTEPIVRAERQVRAIPASVPAPLPTPAPSTATVVAPSTTTSRQQPNNNTATAPQSSRSQSSRTPSPVFLFSISINENSTTSPVEITQYSDMSPDPENGEESSDSRSSSQSSASSRNTPSPTSPTSPTTPSPSPLESSSTILDLSRDLAPSSGVQSDNAENQAQEAHRDSSEERPSLGSSSTRVTPTRTPRDAHSTVDNTAHTPPATTRETRRRPAPPSPTSPTRSSHHPNIRPPPPTPTTSTDTPTTSQHLDPGTFQATLHSTNQMPMSADIRLGESLTVFIQSEPQGGPILFLGHNKPQSATQSIIHQPIPRLTHYIEELNVGRGFIKEVSFSSDGRLICSPFGFGVRLLTFDPDCSEICDVIPSSPVKLYELTTNMSHTSAVVTTKFSPVHCLFVSGCLSGKVDFHQPRL